MYIIKVNDVYLGHSYTLKRKWKKPLQLRDNLLYKITLIEIVFYVLVWYPVSLSVKSPYFCFMMSKFLSKQNIRFGSSKIRHAF